MVYIGIYDSLRALAKILSMIRRLSFSRQEKMTLIPN
jgi:hypothetical protein